MKSIALDFYSAHFPPSLHHHPSRLFQQRSDSHHHQFTMVKYYESITPDLEEWALSQQVFFVASAPLHGKHVNISPKGLPAASFSIFGPNSCGYVDATGSGNETISHIYENGRVTIMFCSFETSPRIMRFFCTGRVVEWDEPEFENLMTKILSKGAKRVEGARAVIMLDVFKVLNPTMPPFHSSSSCSLLSPSPYIPTPLSPSNPRPNPANGAEESRREIMGW